MPEQLENAPDPSPTPNPHARFIPSPANPAVARCCDAFNRTHQRVLAAGNHPVIALLRAHEAFRQALPPLSNSRNIRDFITCIAYGMVTKLILEKSATKLLYAAQVAHNTLPKRSPRNIKPAA